MRTKQPSLRQRAYDALALTRWTRDPLLRAYRVRVFYWLAGNPVQAAPLLKALYSLEAGDGWN